MISLIAVIILSELIGTEPESDRQRNRVPVVPGLQAEEDRNRVPVVPGLQAEED
uniref:Uncharacterized protein n=2 Tax=Guillardia theta (strain CCMP2712) TaxID=905079 RepID=A0A0C3SHB1_GUITC